MPDKPVIYYDEQCRLCQAAVRFIRRRARGDGFQFAPLQTEAGRHVAVAAGLDADTPGSLVWFADGVARVRSDAALRIARHLRFPWPLCGVFRLIPPVLRDALYDLIARHRYRWFGRIDDD